ncbi:hypothetical protein Q3G72_028507 [Acer saccharum]|nr:hypothetical protein Q3G72_028507 [Acer saccharum]
MGSMDTQPSHYPKKQKHSKTNPLHSPSCPILDTSYTRLVHLSFSDSIGKSADMYPKSNSASEVIIGVLDTGVWPESKSYDDTGLCPVPSNWKGICDGTKDDGAKAVAGEEKEEEGEVGSSLTLEKLECTAISIDDEDNFSSQSFLIVEHSESDGGIEDSSHKDIHGHHEAQTSRNDDKNEKSDGGIEDSSHKDIHGHHEAQTRRNDDKNQKAILVWIFVIANFCLEVISSVLEQLSSVHKPQYALPAMIFSFGGMLICIVDLVFKGRTQKVSWRWKEKLPWFYYPSQSHQLPFGTFKDIIGFICALCQCIVTAINYIDDSKTLSVYGDVLDLSVR